MSGLKQRLDTVSGNQAKAYGLHFLYKEIWVGTLWDPRCNNKYRYLTRLGRRRQNISVFTWQRDWSPAHGGAIRLVVTRRTLAECPCRDINVSLGSIALSPFQVSPPSNERCWYCHRLMVHSYTSWTRGETVSHYRALLLWDNTQGGSVDSFVFIFPFQSLFFFFLIELWLSFGRVIIWVAWSVWKFDP